MCHEWRLASWHVPQIARQIGRRWNPLADCVVERPINKGTNWAWLRDGHYKLALLFLYLLESVSVLLLCFSRHCNNGRQGLEMRVTDRNCDYDCLAGHGSHYSAHAPVGGSLEQRDHILCWHFACVGHFNTAEVERVTCPAWLQGPDWGCKGMKKRWQADRQTNRQTEKPRSCGQGSLLEKPWKFSTFII